MIFYYFEIKNKIYKNLFSNNIIYINDKIQKTS